MPCLTERDFDIIRVLSHRVRFLSLEQIARMWWNAGPQSVATAEARMEQLEKSYYVRSLKVRCHPELPLQTPIHLWNPGDPTPDFGAIAYRLQKRWTQPMRRIKIYVTTDHVTARASVECGCLRSPLQAGHDLHVATVYLKLRETWPEGAERWEGEDGLRFGFGHKVPDAIIRHPKQHIQTIVEFGGSYRKGRVKEFHEFWAARNVPYMIW